MTFCHQESQKAFSTHLSKAGWSLQGRLFFIYLFFSSEKLVWPEVTTILEQAWKALQEAEFPLIPEKQFHIPFRQTQGREAKGEKEQRGRVRVRAREGGRRRWRRRERERSEVHPLMMPLLLSPCAPTAPCRPTARGIEELRRRRRPSVEDQMKMDVPTRR